MRTLRVAGAGTRVPADATAVAVNLTAVGATVSTDVRVYPAGPLPNASNSNPGPGRPTSVLAVVGVGRGGAVSLRNTAGRVHLVVDLQGWFVPTASGGSVFHPVAPRRVLDAAATSAGSPRDVVVAGVGSIPAQATGLAVAVTATGSTASTDVAVYPVPADGTSSPPSSDLNPGVGVDVTGSALVAVGRDGAVRLATRSGSVRLSVDVLGWYGPAGRGWDVSWPQCTTQGATTATTPQGGAFAVVGLNRRVPFTDNECFAAEWAWASSLPGEPAVYVNVNAPGSSSPRWGAPGPRPCSGASDDRGCAYNYGLALAAHDVARMPRTPAGGRPFVWFDIENGPVWQSGYSSAFLVNRDVLNGAAAGLRAAGYDRYGIYTDGEPYPADDASPDNDWVQIMGRWSLPQLPLWQFTSSTVDTRVTCARSPRLLPGGPVQMVQLRPGQTPEEYDVDDLC